MKKLVVGTLALTIFAIVGRAGPMDETGQNTRPSANSQAAEPWYRDHEWSFDLFGTYAFPFQSYRGDQYLGVDRAWGGGLGANYMFNRYLGAGVEGYGLAAADAIGQASANLIFRYPVPGSRFAPYAYAGGGVIFNGSPTEDLVDRPGGVRHGGETEGMGQFGAGIELRSRQTSGSSTTSVGTW